MGPTTRQNAADYIYHRSFDDPASATEILGPAPEGARQRLPKAPPGAPPYLASLYEVPVLTREQETYYFRKLNYLKHRIARLRGMGNTPVPSVRDSLELRELLHQKLEVKNLLIRSNLRLVVALVGKCFRRALDFADLVSEGNLALMHAIDRFDFSRGNKFSTFATLVIRNSLLRMAAVEQRRRGRFPTAGDGTFDTASDGRTNPEIQIREHESPTYAVQELLNDLNERERNVLIWRFGLRQDGARLTLAQIGSRYGVTKERIRQIESRALEKLRGMATQKVPDLWQSAHTA